MVSAPCLQRPEVRVQDGEAEAVGRRRQRPNVRGPPVGEVSPLFEERAQGGGELPAVVAEGDRDERGVLGLESAERGVDVVEIG
jgi:hypothetical protein